MYQIFVSVHVSISTYTLVIHLHACLGNTHLYVFVSYICAHIYYLSILYILHPNNIELCAKTSWVGDDNNNLLLIN